MSKIDFRKNPEAVGAAPIQRTSEFVPTPVPGVTIECPATVAVGVPAVYQAPAALARPQAPSWFEEETVSFDEIKFDKIVIVQKVGPRSNIWTPGEILLNDQVVLYSPKHGETPATPPLTIITIGFKPTLFPEKVEFGQRGDMATTEEGVKKLGGTLDYKEWETKQKNGIPCKRFERLSTGLFLVERPAHVKDPDNLIFSQECEGKHYVMATWSMRGAVYNNGAAVIKTDGKTRHLKGPDGKPFYRSWSYALSTELKEFQTAKGPGYAERPVLKPLAKMSDEFIAFTNGIFGA